jgi:hypothetical protein
MPSNALEQFLANRLPPPSDTMSILGWDGRPGRSGVKVSVFDKTSGGGRAELVVAYHGETRVVAEAARRLGHGNIVDHLARLAPATCALVLPWGEGGARPASLGRGPLDHRLGKALGFLRVWLSREELVKHFFAPAYGIHDEQEFWAGAGYAKAGDPAGRPYFFLTLADMPEGY